MQLVFEVCEAEHAEATPVRRKTFNGVGGVIGRGASCDWVIADPSRVLSSRHALVTYRDGRYFLTDISSNGTRLQDSGERLREGHAQPISDGSVFQLGSLSIRARLAAPSMVADHAGLDSQIPDHAFFELEPLQALEAKKTDSSRWADVAATDRDHLTALKLVEPARKAVPGPPVQSDSQGGESFWLAFGEALGIDLANLDPSGREVLAIKTASLLRQTIDGLQQTLRTRDELKHELMLTATGNSLEGENPLQESADAGAALAVLLDGGQLGRLSAEMVIKRAYRELQAHQVALVAACRTALRGSQAAFEPSHLLGCFKHQDKPPLIPTSGAHWRAYQRHYQKMIESGQLSERLLASDFTGAYEEQIRLICALHSYPG